jgi:hypothetical protein
VLKYLFRELFVAIAIVQLGRGNRRKGYFAPIGIVAYNGPNVKPIDLTLAHYFVCCKVRVSAG